MKVDLHVHSTASDGVWTPARVVEGALRGGLDVMALTDHDTTSGVAEALEVARGTGLRVIRAVELSTTREGRELHVLGYFIDPSASALQDHERKALKSRLARMEKMVGRLEKMGVNVTLDAVLEAAGSERRVLARPHLAKALVESGHAATLDDAFARFIGDSLPS